MLPMQDNSNELFECNLFKELAVDVNNYDPKLYGLLPLMRAEYFHQGQIETINATP